MKKKIALITGASGGLGREFVALMINEPLDEIWCVARNIQKSDGLKEQYGDKIVPLSFDLSKQESIVSIKERIEAEQPRIAYLINNAGIGEFLGSSFTVMSIETTHEIIQLNCNAVASLCSICIPTCVNLRGKQASERIRTLTFL